MRSLTATDVLDIWEVAERQGPVERALTILAAACEHETPQQLARLSLGERDRRLLLLRQSLFGPKLDCFSECPQCRERLEFSLDAVEICGAGPTETELEQPVRCTGGVEFRFRLPSSLDLMAAAACSSPLEARRLLVERCVREANRDGSAIASAELPEEAAAQLSARMSQCDPLQEVLVNLSCPACQHGWRSLLEIANFFWAELAAQAKRLLLEVHVLARAYAWREADILAMSAQRRQLYLEMVGT